MKALPLVSALLLASCATEGSSAPQSPASAEPERSETQRIEDDAARHKALEQAASERALRREVAELRKKQAEILQKLERIEAPAPSHQPARPRLYPADTYAVAVVDSPFRGDRDALVTIVKAFEFACPFCERSRATLDQLQNDYKGDVRIVYRHFIVHPQIATEAARAACAAHQQGAWEVFYKLLFDEAFPSRKFARAEVEALARKAGLKMARFRADRDNMCVDLVARDQKELGDLGVTGTPAFFINGRFLSGARPVEDFKVLVDEELAKARKRLREDPTLTPANYYELEVLGKGKAKP